MNRTRAQLLPILCHWITFLAHALPRRSVPPFIELVVGGAAEPAGLGHGGLLGDCRAAALDELLQMVRAGALVMVAVGPVSGGVAAL